MKVLLVEDDDFKAADIRKVVQAEIIDCQIQNASSVTSALRVITGMSFDLVILDMSLPTFDLSGPGGGGSPQSQGGLEILRLARHLKHNSSFVIVTQYPDIEMDGMEISLANASRVLTKKFEVLVKGCILYDFDSDDWRFQVRDILRSSKKA